MQLSWAVVSLFKWEPSRIQLPKGCNDRSNCKWGKTKQRLEFLKKKSFFAFFLLDHIIFLSTTFRPSIKGLWFSNQRNLETPIPLGLSFSTMKKQDDINRWWKIRVWIFKSYIHLCLQHSDTGNPYLLTYL